jgi:hypothetical protein
MHSHLGSLASQLGELAVLHRHSILPTSLNSSLAVFLPWTQPNLLILIGKVQSACQPFEEYSVSPDFLEEWVCFGLACAAAHCQFGELPYCSFEAV